MIKTKQIYVFFILIFLSAIDVKAQEAGRLVVTTGVPFLSINTDARGSSLGASGVASSPDINSQFWNAAKYQFMDERSGISISHSPWLRNVFNDMSLNNISAYLKVDDFQTLSGSLRHLTLGIVEFQDFNSPNVNLVKPYEFAFDIAYTRLLSNEFSAGLAFRYVHSDLKLSQYGSATEYKVGRSIATDLNFYYLKKNNNSQLMCGLQISNIGFKISYSDNIKNFLPSLMRFGFSYKTEIVEKHSITFGNEVSKFLIPSVSDPNGGSVNQMMDNNYNVVSGIIRSFHDSPNGIKGELKELSLSFSLEYSFMDKFFLRTGYFTEHLENGNRKFLGGGLGLSLKNYQFDLSYIFPNQRNHPLGNTLQISLSYKIGEKIKEEQN